MDILKNTRLRVTAVMLFCFTVLTKSFYSQEVQQVAPFFLPRIVVAPGTYYILTQGSSPFLESKFGVPKGSLADSSIVIYEFFPLQGAFKVVTRSTFVRHFFGAAFYKDKIVIAGGYNASGIPTNNIFIFDLNTRKWQESKSTMLRKRAEFALESYGNTLYAVYGDDKGTLETFNEANGKWQLVTANFAEDAKPLKKIRASFAIDNNLYLFADGGGFQVFNVSSGKISNGVVPPAQSSFFGVTGCNRKIYLAAGVDKSGIDYNVYMLNTVDNLWKTVGKVSVDLCGSGLVCHGRMLIFVGGSSTNMFESTNPAGSIFIYRPMY